MSTNLSPPHPSSKEGKLSSQVSREQEKKKQRPTAGAGRKRGGDQFSKRHGH